MTTKNIQDVVAEKVEEFKKQWPLPNIGFDGSSFDYDQRLAQYNWLRTTLTQLVEAAREEEREVVTQLRKILAPQIALYNEYTEKEMSGEVDGSYVYDMACEWFQDLSRGEFCAILEALSTDHSKLDQDKK